MEWSTAGAEKTTGAETNASVGGCSVLFVSEKSMRSVDGIIELLFDLHSTFESTTMAESSKIDGNSAEEIRSEFVLVARSITSMMAIEGLRIAPSWRCVVPS